MEAICSIGTSRRNLEVRFRARRAIESGPHLDACSFSTDLGWMAIAARNEALVEVVFGYTSRRGAERVLAERASAAIQFDDSPILRTAADRLTRFADGEPVEFSDLPIAIEWLTPFARRVVTACRKIRRGETRSYGDLAAACGSPGAARAVGSVMAKNRFPLIVPCHRVVGSGGGLGGYSAPDGLRMKRRLLAMEQLAF
jgi:methylated-DNA-[protein]-cysteine S-methyltransferase